MKFVWVNKRLCRSRLIEIQSRKRKSCLTVTKTLFRHTLNEYIYIYVGYLGSPLTNGVKMNRSGSLLLSVDGITIYASHSRGAQRTLNLNGVH